MSRTAVTLYTRVDCHLCDEAKAVLEEVRRERPFELTIVDVDTDPALVEAYGLEVPVILVGGRKAFKYRVDPEGLKARLDQADSAGA
ncbi:MAG: glutaredoxin family protein [Polyangiaceae bacterium]